MDPMILVKWEEELVVYHLTTRKLRGVILSWNGVEAKLAFALSVKAIIRIAPTEDV